MLKLIVSSISVFLLSSVALAAPNKMSCRLSKSVQNNIGWEVVATDQLIVQRGGTLAPMQADNVRAQVHLSARGVNGLVTLVLGDANSKNGGASSQGLLTEHTGVSLGSSMDLKLESDGVVRAQTSAFLVCDPVAE